MEVPALPEAKLAEQWYFEWLSSDGKRALLRRIDSRARSSFEAKIVDVETGASVEEAALEDLEAVGEMARGLRGGKDLHELDAKLAEPALGEDLVRGAAMTTSFPFGSCGRFSAATNAIAFNAGDWIYLADKTGHVKTRVADVASYDPRFTPDGKNLLFRRANGKFDHWLAKYELFVMPSDQSAPPRALEGTAGARDRIVIDYERKTATVVASHEPFVKTCALSIGLRPPFAVKRMACLDGGEQLSDSVLSPKGRWVALTTHKPRSDGQGLTFRLRVASLATGKIVLDEPSPPGLLVRAISDSGILVESGGDDALIVDVPKKKRRTRNFDPGHRAYFRGASELVYVDGSSVAVADLARK